MYKLHPFDMPTVGLFIEVPESDAGTAWHWVNLCEQIPAREYVYSKRDLYRSLVSYGSLAAYKLRPLGYVRFRLIARGLFTMRFLAEYVWEWKPCAGAYEPVSDPWIVWPPINELPEEVRRGAKLTGQLPGDEPLP
ncbi:hypothetical protein AB0G42_21610 [Streptomyces yangpuensis]|uniref:hypothetical protein n=1 Tax=Streptomyces yangpuensis TaxID=1648182 RepID=UPI0034261788